MREAVGNSLVMGLMASIIGVIMIFFVGSISYSKAYKVKNKLINLIEESGNENSTKTIDNYLKEVGYQVGAGRGLLNKCNCDNENKKSGLKCVQIHPTSASNTGSVYNYCVLKYLNESNGEYYYKVTSYMRFEFPIIGSALEFPVSGETKTFNYFSGK